MKTDNPLFPLVPKSGHFMHVPNLFLQIISALVMYGMIFLFLLADTVATFYQFVYFSSFKIPKIKRSDYMKVFDRARLSKLNPMQKVACVYCGYANGVTSYVKAIVVQTEIYSCAIKHEVQPAGQEHILKEGYYEYEKYA